MTKSIMKRVDLKDKNVMTDILSYVSISCNLSDCCFHSFKHSKRYNRAKTKTCHLPGNWPLTTDMISQYIYLFRKI